MAENTTIEKKYLDLTGLSEFWKRVKKYVDAGGTALNGLTTDLSNTKINDTAILGQNTKLHGGNLHMTGNTSSETIADVISAMMVNDYPLYDTDGGQSITLYADDIAMSSSDTTKISAKISNITDNLGNITTELGDMRVNGKSLYKSNAGQSINLYASDIAMSATDTTKISAKIDALSSATHFKGVTQKGDAAITDGSTNVPASIYSGQTTPKAGDVIVSGNKEFIWDGAKWIELGDTTAELAAIDAINDWIDSNTITNTDLNNATNFPGLPSL